MKIVKVDVDENQETAGKYGIMSIPTLIVFKDGEIVDKVVGFQPKEALSELLRKTRLILLYLRNFKSLAWSFFFDSIVSRLRCSENALQLRGIRKL